MKLMRLASLNLKKREAVIIGLAILLALLGLGIYRGLATIADRPTAPQDGSHVVTMEFIYPANYADDRVLVGASHNVFVGKIVAQTGSIERGAGPETQFAVQVISNIKGNLQGTVTVDQQGGYKNGVLYVVGNSDVFGGSAGRYLLQIGSTYLLATRYNPTSNWYTLNPFPSASKLISADPSQANAQLQVLAANDPRVLRLQVAYSNEVLLPADIAKNNTLNSYRSTHPVGVSAPIASSTTSTSTSNSASSIAVTAATSTVVTTTISNTSSTSN